MTNEPHAVPYRDWMDSRSACRKSHEYFPALKCDLLAGHAGWCEGYMPHYDTSPLRGARQARATWREGRPANPAPR